MSHISFDGVSCASPDGSILFPEFSASISSEIVGLFGRNGSGKSTLLEAIAGNAPLATGTIGLDGKAALMRQVAFDPAASISAALGVQSQLEVLERIEAGLPHEGDLDRADWTLQLRLEQVLESCGLPDIDLKRRVDTLSGGEQSRLNVAHALIGEPDILLLDEPTNNLDIDGREMIAALLEKWTGPALVASHDRWLLERMDRMIELSPVGVTMVGGGWSAFTVQREAERARAQQALDKAQRDAGTARKTAQAQAERQAQRSKQGRVGAARRDDTRMEVNARKERADKTSARTETLGSAKVEHADAALAKAQQEVERTIPIRLELPPTGLLRGHTLVDLGKVTCVVGSRRLFGPLDLTITGPERISLRGPNGSGKTCLIRLIAGYCQPSSGSIRANHDRIGVLDQSLALEMSDETLLDAMRRQNPLFNRHDAHAALAQYGFRGSWADRSVGTLSGGEKVRLGLACLFSRPLPPQLLILDEPTNHLDVEAIELLEQALQSYDGALICVTHDQAFRDALGLDRVITLQETSK